MIILSIILKQLDILDQWYLLTYLYGNVLD